MEPRDVLIIDSEVPLLTDVRTDFVAINVSVTNDWLRQWIPSPNRLATYRIPGGSTWGLALSSFLGELSPELAAAPPLPLSLIADQVGSLLALTASAMQAERALPKPRSLQSLQERIESCILERCTEPHLTATDVAESLGISVRTMHRAMTTYDTTFGARLLEARTQTAIRMLMSSLFKRVTTGEIGRRSGFLSASHFLRVIRNRTGMTPLQLRRASNT
jgi:AraC-like DNA-binding protein